MSDVNAEKFVQVLKLVTCDHAAKAGTRSLKEPPGRRPSARLRRLSDWFKTVSAQDQEKVTELWSLAAEDAVFDVLCVLDGVRAIESQSDKGTLELYYVKGDQRILLNAEDNPLHDIFQGFRSFE
jgi:hypothetical protein